MATRTLAVEGEARSPSLPAQDWSALVAAVGPEGVIEAPPGFANPYGLIASSTTVDHTAEDREWAAGLRLVPESCAGMDLWATCSTGATGVLTGGRNRGAPYAFEPFVGMVRDECGTWGWSTNDYEARAIRRLEAIESAAVEQEFWTGALIPANPRLAGPAATNIGLNLGLRLALATLVQGLATQRVGRGMIHARPLVVEMWASHGELVERQGRLTTPTGHVVVPGQGYTGEAPDGTDPATGLEYAYATDWIVVDRSPIVSFAENMAAVTDHKNNAVAVRAQRAYGIRWNRCAHLSVQVNVGAS